MIYSQSFFSKTNAPYHIRAAIYDAYGSQFDPKSAIDYLNRLDKPEWAKWIEDNLND